jgi:imidazole glycerol-phosphate synthase subunit HisH
MSMAKKITLIDYGLGNIYSVSRAIEHFGAEVELTDDPAKVRGAERVLLPGVGAFANGMQGLRDKNLVEPLREFAASGRPFLGICLGMQMLVTTSEEFGRHAGLGIVPGKVVEIAGRADGHPVKVPHIGWNALERPPQRARWGGTILEGVPEESNAYFVHSFAVVPDEESDRLADTWHGDFRISAAIQHANVSGCQFHPEKSGPTGLRIIRNFLAA